MSVTRLWALVEFRLGSHCLLSKADLLDPASRAISVDAAFAALKLLAMSIITFSTALALLPLGLQFVSGCWRLYAFVHVAQIPKGCQPLPHSHSANGPDMNTDPSS